MGLSALDQLVRRNTVRSVGKAMSAAERDAAVF